MASPSEKHYPQRIWLHALGIYPFGTNNEMASDYGSLTSVTRETSFYGARFLLMNTGCSNRYSWRSL